MGKCPRFCDSGRNLVELHHHAADAAAHTDFWNTVGVYPGKDAFSILPPAVAGLALLLTFGRRGLVGGALDSIGITIPFTPFAVILAQTFVAAPFYIRAAQVGFLSVSKEIEDAARVDGAPSLALFLRITLPLSSRALAAGLILCWARALGEFGATILFAGSLQGRTQTMPLLIYNIIERDLDAAVWTGLILIALALVAMIISQALARSAVEDNAAYEIM
jgi:molybdate transport system permease protein